MGPYIHSFTKQLSRSVVAGSAADESGQSRRQSPQTVERLRQRRGRRRAGVDGQNAFQTSAGHRRQLRAAHLASHADGEDVDAARQAAGEAGQPVDSPGGVQRPAVREVDGDGPRTTTTTSCSAAPWGVLLPPPLS